MTEINREYTRLWRLAGKPTRHLSTDAERLNTRRAIRRKSREKHKTQEIARSAQWHKLHRKETTYKHKNQQRAARWRRANPKRHLQNVANWQTAHPEKARAAKRKWKQNNPARVNFHTAQRRARIKNATLPGDQWEILQVYERAQWWCDRGFDVEVDHIYPPGFGWHEPANLQIIYARENQSKNANPDYKPSRIFT